MTDNKKFSSMLASRRTILMGGLATVSMGALSGCFGEDKAKKQADTSGKSDSKAAKASGDLPENVLGSADAPVTLIEYSSMTCPHCANFHNNVLPGFKKKYIDTGKVKYIIREFPFDPLATFAFMLARCSGKDTYFPMVDALYATQNTWTAHDVNKVDKLREITKQIGLSKEDFDKCTQNKELEKQILAVKKRGADELGVRATPTFFINGERFEKAYTLEALSQTIDPLLNTAGN